MKQVFKPVEPPPIAAHASFSFALHSTTEGQKYALVAIISSDPPDN